MYGDSYNSYGRMYVHVKIFNSLLYNEKFLLRKVFEIYRSTTLPLYMYYNRFYGRLIFETGLNMSESNEAINCPRKVTLLSHILEGIC